MTAGKKKKAIALHYDRVNAPKVSAKGVDDIAEQIVAIAKEHDIPLLENEEMLQLLSEVSLNEEIPRSLYLCIAGVIAFAYKMKGKKPDDEPSDETERHFTQDESE
mgnify:CR=1 FL=1